MPWTHLFIAMMAANRHSSFRRSHIIFQESTCVANRMWGLLIAEMTTPLIPLWVPYFQYTSSCAASCATTTSIGSSLVLGRDETWCIVSMAIEYTQSAQSVKWSMLHSLGCASTTPSAMDNASTSTSKILVQSWKMRIGAVTNFSLSLSSATWHSYIQTN